MTYFSGEFDPGLSVISQSPGAACVVSSTTDSTLWFAGADEYGIIQLGEVTLTGVAAGGCSRSGLWSTEKLSVQGWRGGAICTSSTLGLTVAGEPLIVWNNGSNGQMGAPSGVYAAAYGVAGAGNSWANPVRLLRNQRGNPPLWPDLLYTGVDAVAWGTDAVFVAAASTGGSLYVAVFSLDDQDVGGGSWIPRQELLVAPADIARTIPGVKDTGTTVSLDWFVTGSTSGTPELQLAVCVSPSSTVGPVVGYLSVVLDDDARPTIDTTKPVLWDHFPGIVTGPMTIARDPAGRLRGYAVQAKELVTLTFRTTGPPAAATSVGHCLPLIRVDQRAAPHGANFPVVAFSVDPAEKLDHPDGGRHPRSRDGRPVHGCAVRDPTAGL